jgi:hypothetical protein
MSVKPVDCNERGALILTILLREFG